jgi:hypothetical protein
LPPDTGTATAEQRLAANSALANDPRLNAILAESGAKLTVHSVLNVTSNGVDSSILVDAEVDLDRAVQLRGSIPFVLGPAKDYVPTSARGYDVVEVPASAADVRSLSVIIDVRTRTVVGYQPMPFEGVTPKIVIAPDFNPPENIRRALSGGSD